MRSKCEVDLAVIVSPTVPASAFSRDCRSGEKLPTANNFHAAPVRAHIIDRLVTALADLEGRIIFNKTGRHFERD
jgi:O-succinylbenzoate synthase